MAIWGRVPDVIRRPLRSYVVLEWRDRVLRLLPTLRARVAEEIGVRAARRALVDAPPTRVVTVIPTFRRPELLRAAVESALAQSVDDNLVIVVDDGGGLTELASHPRLVVVSLPRNIGVAGAVRNVGIRASRSEVVAFLDDDNQWLPHHLQAALDVLDAGADLTYTSVRYESSDGTVVGVIGEPFVRRTLRHRNFVDTSATVLRRDHRTHFSRVPRRKGDRQIEDWELVYRVSRRGRVRHVPEVTVRYLAHEGSYYSSWDAARIADLFPVSERDVPR